jgi:hypothetical protein
MAHDVFISHAHKDKQLADAICEKLESAQVKCWIADRDISIGEDWTEATRKAIGSSHVMVLVLSENANAAPHIEREIAHAFYTGRRIVPVRMTNTLPRRDFLFYLGNVRWFDAFNPPPEGHLEALTASINGMVHGHNDPGVAPVSENKAKTRERLDFSDSWLGALRASHYQTLENLKRVGIAVSIGAAGWLLWFAVGQTKREEFPADGDLHPGNQSSVPLASSPEKMGSPSAQKPAYTFSRFGLWTTPTIGLAPSILPRPQDALSPPPTAPAPSATPSPAGDVKQETTGEAEGPEADNATAVSSKRGDSPRTARRNQGHRGKSRTKGHHERIRASKESREARKRHAAKKS